MSVSSRNQVALAVAVTVATCVPPSRISTVAFASAAPDNVTSLPSTVAAEIVGTLGATVSTRNVRLVAVLVFAAGSRAVTAYVWVPSVTVAIATDQVPPAVAVTVPRVSAPSLTSIDAPASAVPETVTPDVVNHWFWVGACTTGALGAAVSTTKFQVVAVPHVARRVHCAHREGVRPVAQRVGGERGRAGGERGRVEAALERGVRLARELERRGGVVADRAGRGGQRRRARSGRVDDEGAGRRRVVRVARAVDRPHLERVPAHGKRRHGVRRRAGGEGRRPDPALEARVRFVRAERELRRGVVAGRRRPAVDRRVRPGRVGGEGPRVGARCCPPYPSPGR